MSVKFKWKNNEINQKDCIKIFVIFCKLHDLYVTNRCYDYNTVLCRSFSLFCNKRYAKILFLHISTFIFNIERVHISKEGIYKKTNDYKNILFNIYI